MIKTVMHKQNLDVLVITLLAKLHIASVTPNAGEIMKADTIPSKRRFRGERQRVTKLLDHYRTHFVP